MARSIFKGPAEEALMLQSPAIPFDPALWETLAQAGLTLLTTPEVNGGSGAGFDDAAVVLAAAAEYAAPGPLVEADMLAAWLQQKAGFTITGRPTTAALGSVEVDSLGFGARIHGIAERVPWARDCDAVVVLVDLGDRLAVFEVKVADAELTYGHNIAYEPRDSVRFDAQLNESTLVTVAPETLREWRLRGAFARAVQSCAAMQSALALTIDHASQRIQFGRTIGKFQSVQNLVASAAGEAAVAQTAVDTATCALVKGGFDSAQAELTIGIAKAQCARAARIVARHSHQVHGAIGFTLDHQLRHFSMSALGWQQEFGGDREWNRRIGQLLTDSGVSSTWDLLVDGLPNG
ncbi:acyl-CoA dehydrogenase family protein [Rhodococcoides fascians]|uniref:acyl-CoA dehydrogenase family protein n=1 Tax=Rhodococcoides fascians TaxID=1828 RepID=UPI001E438C33|nr:acyl-CoA dehydrogenase family protein [Rhodococcus fascians]